MRWDFAEALESVTMAEAQRASLVLPFREKECHVLEDNFETIWMLIKNIFP